MLPNHKVAGDPNSSNKKINLSNIELKLFNKHNVYSDQCLGAVHLFLNKKEEKIIKGFILIFYDHHKASVGKGYAQNNSHEQQICFCTQRKGHRQGHPGVNPLYDAKQVQLNRIFNLCLFTTLLSLLVVRQKYQSNKFD